jgi:hypothetical protein
MHFLKPKDRISEQEIRDLIPAVIKDIGIPMGMKSLSGIFMFVQRCSIEAG